MKLCTNCVLPENFPGIKFKKNGICNHCYNFKGRPNLEEKKQKYKKRFEELIKEHKGKSSYDALMCYSGGKDSTYTLSILKEKYRLRVLAITFDNGFLPEQTFRNIQKVIEKLDIDHYFFKPRFGLLKKIFVVCSKKNIYSQMTLTRASTICTACMAIVKSSALHMALEKYIPFIMFGWSPGQSPIASSIMKNNPQIIKVMQKALFKPLYDLVGNEIMPYFLEEKHFNSNYYFPFNISPLAFLGYNEDKIFDKIAQLGWKIPNNIDANTTNCLLNSYANIIHKDQYGYHPYVFEMAKLVREGYLERSAALQKLNQPENPKTVKSVEKKLDL